MSKQSLQTVIQRGRAKCDKSLDVYRLPKVRPQEQLPVIRLQNQKNCEVSSGIIQHMLHHAPLKDPRNRLLIYCLFDF